MSDTPYPRDMVGYGRTRPHPHWPGDARIAVQFVINYEEGAENSVLHGDAGSETLLTEFGFVEPRVGERALPVESMYEFGSRVGFWRLHRLFTERAVPVTIFGVAMALQRNPDAVAAMVEAEWEIASHGYRWIDYHTVPEAEERAHIEKVIAIQTALTGTRPLGYFLGPAQPTHGAPRGGGGRLSLQPGFLRRRAALLGRGGRPAPADDPLHGGPQRPPLRDLAGLRLGRALLRLPARRLRCALRGGRFAAPGMMSIGLHSRLVGRPGRFAALRRFVDHVLAHDRVWLCRGIDIARHWRGREDAP